MKRIPRSRSVIALASGLSPVAVLAGCASTTSADSTYGAQGGDDEIAVSITVKSNTITGVKVTTVAGSSLTSQGFDSAFATFRGDAAS